MTRLDLDGIPVVISRTGWTAVVGYEIYLRDPSRGDDLWERILDAGKPYGIRVTPSSDIRRIEAGIFDWGSDIGLENNPFEVTGLERLVEQQDADYIGKAALERIRREGVTRKLVGIELEGDPVDQPTQHWPVSVAGELVGHVTDACWSPRLEKNIGYVWLPIGLVSPGTRVDVQTDDGERAGMTAALPLVDPPEEGPSRLGSWKLSSPRDTGANGRGRLSARARRCLRTRGRSRRPALHGRGDEDLGNLADAEILAAMITAIPPALASIVSTSPVCTPARISIPSGRTASTAARAQRTARAGPSNVAKKPSPAVSISVPRDRASRSRIIL